jgi:hypothetical protein
MPCVYRFATPTHVRTDVGGRIRTFTIQWMSGEDEDEAEFGSLVGNPFVDVETVQDSEKT